MRGGEEPGEGLQVLLFFRFSYFDFAQISISVNKDVLLLFETRLLFPQLARCRGYEEGRQRPGGPRSRRGDRCHERASREVRSSARK